jgi:hypothetical protein
VLKAEATLEATQNAHQSIATKRRKHGTSRLFFIVFDAYSASLNFLD